MDFSRSDTVVCYGDSQTAGFSWGNRFPTLSPTIKAAVGRGVSGQCAGSVAIRQGGIVLSTTEAVTIPASGSPVTVGVVASVTPCNIRWSASDMPLILGGVRGVATVANADAEAGIAAWSNPMGTGTVVFTPSVPPAEDVAVPLGTDFVSQDVVDHPEWAECVHIIWVGGNDSAYAGATRVTGVVSGVQAIVDRLGDAVTSPRFLCASRTVRSTDTPDTAGFQTAVDQREALKAAFPENAVDIWGHVRDHGLGILGITPTAEDTAALEAGAMPPSLTTDGLHLSTPARERVLAPFLIDEMASRGWITKSTEEVPVAEYTPTIWQNKPSTATPLSAANLNNIEAGIQSASESASSAAQGVADLREDLSTKADKAELASLATKTELETKVPIKDVASKNTVYGISNGGSLFMYPTGVSTVAASTVAMRGTGGVLKVGTATADDHAVTLKQLNDAVAALNATITSLTDRVAALETPPAEG